MAGTKELTGGHRELKANEFTFDIYAADSGYVYAGDPIKSVKNAADGTISFDGLTFDEAGTYYYVASEDTSAKAERITYDETKYYIKVFVVDDTENGKLVTRIMAKDSLDDTVYAEDIVFKNTFTPKPDDLTVSIPVDKKVVNKGSESITPEGFTFRLHNVGTGKDIDVKSDKDGKTKFDLVFSENDIGKTYDYRLTEINDGRVGVKYSQEAYNISISISLGADKKLVAKLTKNGAEVTSLAAEFVNEYEYVKPDEDPDKKPDKDKNLTRTKPRMINRARIIASQTEI